MESSYGAIECKSTLTVAELENAIQKINRYRAMHRPVAKEGQIMVSPHFSITAGTGLIMKRTENVQPLERSHTTAKWREIPSSLC